MSKSKTMMFILVASESFFFLALIISFVYYSRANGHLSETAQYLEIGKTSIFTFFLLSSSLTIELADKKLLNGKRKPMLLWLGLSILFGLVFLFGQGMEYSSLIHKNVTVSQNLFGSAFFTLTGFHGLHVLIGLITLSILAGLVGSGKFKAVEYEAFNTATIYWHFVDAVWVVVFIVVYVTPVL